MPKVIKYIKDEKDRKFIVKQIIDGTPISQIVLVLDALGCYLAEKNDIPFNVVKIISPDVPFTGKTRVELPATFHTFAPGISTNKPNCKFHGLDIQQHVTNPWKQPDERITIPPEKTGLTLIAIQNMARHSDLPKIMALDTFVGNPDREPQNLFYDEATDKFCAIDMSAAFCMELAKEACRQIGELKLNKIQLTESEKSALEIYVSTLKSLLVSFPPQKTQILFLKFAASVGFIGDKSLVEKKLMDRIIQFHINVIRNSYRDCKLLVDLIENFLINKE